MFTVTYKNKIFTFESFVDADDFCFRCGIDPAAYIMSTSLIEQFNAKSEISLTFDAKISLKNISDKRQELSNALKRIKQLDKILDDIHQEYTYSLEPTK